MIRSVTLFAAAVALALPLHAAGSPVDDLDWIAGTWAGKSGEIAQEEHWTRPGGGLILGVHRDLFGNGRVFFEFLRIEQRGEDVFYVAMPRGEGATSFQLVELEGQRAVFENPEHDFPQRIIYEREGDRLTATIEGRANGEIRSTGWSWTRVRGD